MKVLAVGIAVAAALVGTSAWAADIPLKVPAAAPPPAAFTWTGCYIGGHGGYGWGRNRNSFGSAVDFGTDDDPGESFANFDHDTNGWVAGVQYGCNTQFLKNWVFGIESEFSWTGMKGSVSYPEDEAEPEQCEGPCGNRTGLQSKNTYDTTLAVRLGYALDRNLFYGKVGAAWGRFEYDETHDDFPTHHACNGCTVTERHTDPGLLLGAGWEYAFYDNWSFKVEYDHIWFENARVIYPSTDSPPGSFGVKNSKDIVKVGINYLFPIGGFLH